jgi:hypothetical protein
MTSDRFRTEQAMLDELLAYVRENGRICPTRWHELWEMLPGRRVGSGSEPPLPLILGAWDSPALLKILRLQEHIRYAEAHGCLRAVDRYLRGLAESDWEHLGRNLGVPIFSQRSFEPKVTPSRHQIESALRLLKERWETVVGPELARITKPLGFTGRKLRRLVVQADTYSSPPWGSWNRLERDERRRAFTRFRSSVNEAIRPLVVDHIDFVCPNQR